MPRPCTSTTSPRRAPSTTTGGRRRRRRPAVARQVPPPPAEPRFAELTRITRITRNTPSDAWQRKRCRAFAVSAPGLQWHELGRLDAEVALEVALHVDDPGLLPGHHEVDEAWLLQAALRRLQDAD